MAPAPHHLGCMELGLCSQTECFIEQPHIQKLEWEKKFWSKGQGDFSWREILVDVKFEYMF